MNTQQQARISSYLSTPSLEQDIRSPSSSMFSHSYQNMNRQQQLLQKPPVRSQSVVSILRNDSPRLVYSTDAALLDISRKSFSNTETSRQRNINITQYPKRAITPEMFANHLVWNKNSKSAESLDTKKFHSSSTNLAYKQQPQYRSRSNFESGSFMARTVSPGHDLRRNSDEYRSRSGQFEFNSRQSDLTRDFEYNYVKENKIGANINSIINSNNHLATTSISYTPVSNGNIIKPRSYSPILSAINKASFERSQDKSNSNLFKSYVTITRDGPPQIFIGKDHYNDYNRLNLINNNNFANQFTNSSEFLSQVSRSNTESESKILSSKVDYYANAEDRVHLKSYEERFNEQKRKEEMEKKIVGGIKVYPTIPRDHKQAEIIRQVNRLKELENEYNFIDSDKTFRKEVSFF